MPMFFSPPTWSSLVLFHEINELQSGPPESNALHAPAAELFSKHPILLAKILNDLQLALVHPPGDGDQQKPEWVEHSLRIQNPLSRPPSRNSEISHLPADPVFGPYVIPIESTDAAERTRYRTSPEFAPEPIFGPYGVNTSDN